MSSLDGFGPMDPRMRMLGEGPGKALGGQGLSTGGIGANELGTEGLEGETEGTTFGSMLEGMLDDVVARKQEVKQKVDDLAMGKPVDLHDVMISMGKSEMQFNLMLEVRNKFVDAWRELQRSVV